MKSWPIKVMTSALLLLFSFASVASANQPAFRAKSIGGEKSAVFFVEERATDSRSLVVSSGMSFFERPWIKDDPIPNMGECRSTKDPDCDFTKLHAGIASSVLGVCDSSSARNCIESISFGPSSESLVPAKFVKYLEGREIDEDPEMGFYGGRTASIWSADNAANSSGSTNYLVAPVVDFSIYQNEPRFRAVGFAVDITPYSTKFKENVGPGGWRTNEERLLVDSTRASWPLRFLPKSKDGDYSGECIAFQKDQCLIQYDFPPSTVIQLRVRLGRELGGWFKGRLVDPDIKVESIDGENNLISVTARPTEVAQVAHAVDYDKMTAQEQALHDEYYWGGGKIGRSTAGTASTGGADRVFDFMRKARDIFKDTALGTTTFWNFGTVNAGAGSQCLADTSKVLGIVTTNAMGYQGTAPAFDGSTLNYRVVGPHYMPGGKVEVRGTYDLVMRSDVARCLYRFNEAPISATVSIASSSGEAQVATTSVSESGGWLRMSAKNFTFSEKVVSVKVSQESPAAATVQPTPTPTPSVVATPKEVTKPGSRKTISCVKGTTVKRVTGKSPRCPKGFKKRSV